MKFARYLEDNAVSEWSRAYINYRGLKKLIKQVNARRTARLSTELDRQTSRASTAIDGLRRRRSSFARSNSGGVLPSGAVTPSAYGGVGAGAGIAQSPPQDSLGRPLPPVSLVGTGLRLSLDEGHRRAPSPDVGSDDTKVAHGGLKGKGSEHASSTEGERPGLFNVLTDLESHKASEMAGPSAIIVPAPPRSPMNEAPRPPPQAHVEQGTSTAAMSPGIRIDEGDAPERRNAAAADGRETAAGAASRAASTKTKGSKKSGKSGKKAKKNQLSLDEILDENFDDEERKFFGALDAELERIVDFFEAKESEMHKKYELLTRQLRELADHRREFKAMQHAAPMSGQALSRIGLGSFMPGQAKSTLRKFTPGLSQSTEAEDAEGSNGAQAKPSAAQQELDEGDRRRSLALARMLEQGSDAERADAEIRRDLKAAATSHNPERYVHARKKLKAAMLEYYRGLELLRNYRILNRAGFTKILKKFEKTTGVAVADAYYHAKVSPSVLVCSTSIEKLLVSSEEIYTAYFEHGQRKRALARLRANTGGAAGEQHTHHMSASRTGFFLGIALCAVVAGIIEAMQQQTSRNDIPQWQALLRVYGAEFIPTLFALLFGLNLAAWHRARINTTFIFEWDVRHAMDHRQFFELPAFFMMLLGAAFYVSFLNPFPSAIAPTTWPLVWLVAVIVVLIDPLPINLPHSRRWFVRSMGRVFGAGLLSGVEFRDFFLGDELNSLAWSMSMLWFFGCQYQSNWAVPDQCDPNKTFWTAALTSVPALLRLGQCFRRFEDSKRTTYLHLVNAAKYMSAILFYWFYLNYRYHGSSRKQDLVLWCFFGVIYSIYTSAWDLLMDWSLLRPHARHPFLRDELAFADVWPVYYVAIVVNVILRFSWTIYLLPGSTGLLKVFVIALLEALRRVVIWNIFRLENEHLGNADSYRAFREIPLPYRLPKAEASGEEEEQSRSNGGGPMAMLRRHAGLGGRRRTSASGSGEDNDETDSDDEPEQAMRFPKQPEEASSPKKKSAKQRWDKLRGRLVPDHGGLAAIGDTLAEQGAAHGAAARDYEPRQLEAEGESRQSSEAGEVSSP